MASPSVCLAEPYSGNPRPVFGTPRTTPNSVDRISPSSESLDAKTLNLTAVTPAAKDAFVVYGYGLYQGDYGQQRTAEATVNCLELACDDSRLVAGGLLANSGACEGDSGGPALDGNAFAFALASRNTADCTVTAYLTFTNHLDWLKTATSKAAAQKDYDVPEWAALGPTPGDTSGDTSGCGGASDGSGGAENCSTGTVASNRLHAVGGGGCSFRPTTPTPWLPL